MKKIFLIFVCLVAVMTVNAQEWYLGREFGFYYSF